MTRQREKNCDRCQAVFSCLFRVQHDASKQWIFVCQKCCSQVSENNTHYCYGGTWKSKKRS